MSTKVGIIGPRRQVRQHHHHWGNNASQYGIGIVCARLTEAVLRDERVIFPVASYQETYGVTLSLPSVVGGGAGYSASSSRR